MKQSRENGHSLTRPEKSDRRNLGERPPFRSRRVVFAGIFVLVVAAIVVASAHWQQPPPPTDASPHATSIEMEVAPAFLKPRTTHPATLKDLLALPSEALASVDTATLNLLCAAGLRGADSLDVESSLDSLDAWARHVASETQRNYHRFLANPREYHQSLGYYRMMMLATVLQQDFGTHYNPERAVPQLRGKWEPNDAFFGDSRDVFIHGLLGDKHRGTCSSLPVLYVAAAQRLGYPVELVAAKGHLFVRYQEGADHLNVEATSIGFNTYPDEHYRRWPRPITDEEARTFGWLRSMSKPEMLGAFLAIRAACLTSMKRFDDAAESWASAAIYLPVTPDLKSIVERARQRAKVERAADRWDELWEEIAHLQLPFGSGFAQFRDRQMQLQLFMNQSTNLVEIERAVADLKQGIEADRRQAMLMSDSNGSMLSPPVPPTEAVAGGSEPLQMAALLAAVPQPVRVRIPAERVPHEYWQAIPPELQRQLNGLTREQEIVTEIWRFHAEQLNRSSQAAMAAMAPKSAQPLPRNVQRDWLPAEYHESLPAELRSRLAHVSSREQVQWTVRQYLTAQEALRSAEEMTANAQAKLPLTAPPVQIEIIPPKAGEP